jgi:hypothetical protein
MFGSGVTGGSFKECSQAILDNLAKSSSGLGLRFEVIAEASRNPLLGKSERETYEEATDVVAECLEGWRKQGSLRKKLDTLQLARGLVAFYEGLMTCLAIGIERSEVKKTFVEFSKATEEGILQNAS